jgi:hypothetical protein
LLTVLLAKPEILDFIIAVPTFNISSDTFPGESMLESIGRSMLYLPPDNNEHTNYNIYGSPISYLLVTQELKR